MEPIIVEQRRTNAAGVTVTYRMWRASWMSEDGQRKTVSLGNADVVSRAAARAKLVAKMRADEQPKAATITVAEWVDKCVAAMRVNKAETTVADYERTAKMLKDRFGPRALRSITTEQADAWMGSIEGGAYTQRRYAIVAAAFFERATRMPTREKPYLTTSPWIDVKIPKPGETADVRFISIAERQRLIESLPDSNWRALVTLTGLMALRVEEAFAVTPADVNHNGPDGPFIVVRLRKERKGQGGGTKQGTRLVYFSPAAYAIIRERLETMPEGARTIVDGPSTRTRFEGKPQHPQDHLRRFMEHAGILGVRKPFQDLRLAQADDWSVLHGCERSAEWCGHTFEVALKHYRQRTDKYGALVTKKGGNPKEELERAYSLLDEAFTKKERTMNNKPKPTPNQIHAADPDIDGYIVKLAYAGIRLSPEQVAELKREGSVSIENGKGGKTLISL